MKKNKKIKLFEDIECDVLQLKSTPEMDRETSEFIKAYRGKIAVGKKMTRKTKVPSEK